ncbi:NAD(P)-dependent alcohol dehydrogenase [Microbacterium paludicola]|uniref:NAD(P)-dependent alcohol dehydrogenase n=1 Tax=Microbacterium paludicola TaxID=300019 RepID=A0A4Y9FZ26_9MICO|nr:NAD(P)-dependent alcohol dehydrogenase [Microbacterium paludicola]MBF0815736.1 NAD(P)-dependent alcohol dehydrogenase [Microbacterium paludicola]TFU33574.1 NAD(P)-dependent alcohol dehydrogenase [Microbacterium paludicola]
MRAAVVTRYGAPDRVVIQNVSVPKPRAGHVLVRVHATAVTAGNARIRAARFPPGFGVLARPAIGFLGPRVRTLGGTLSGVVEQVGPGVIDFEPGDEVAGMTGTRMRSHAELAVAPIRSLARKPPGVTHADAAGILFGGSTALYFLRDRAKVTAGESVLVNGAAGSVGSTAVQLARHLGATVTAVTSDSNRDLVLRLGATSAIDYRTTAATEIGARFDVVFDAVGNISRSDGLPLLSDSGRLVLAVASLAGSVLARGRVIVGVTPERADDLSFLLGLVATGELDAVTRVVGGLEDAPEAHRVVDSGRKVGNLVILPNGGTGSGDGRDVV